MRALEISDPDHIDFEIDNRSTRSQNGSTTNNNVQRIYSSSTQFFRLPSPSTFLAFLVVILLSTMTTTLYFNHSNNSPIAGLVTEVAQLRAQVRNLRTECVATQMRLRVLEMGGGGIGVTTTIPTTTTSNNDLATIETGQTKTQAHSA